MCESLTFNSKDDPTIIQIRDSHKPYTDLLKLLDIPKYSTCRLFWVEEDLKLKIESDEIMMYCLHRIPKCTLLAEITKSPATPLDHPPRKSDEASTSTSCRIGEGLPSGQNLTEDKSCVPHPEEPLPVIKKSKQKMKGNSCGSFSQQRNVTPDLPIRNIKKEEPSPEENGLTLKKNPKLPKSSCGMNQKVIVFNKRNFPYTDETFFKLTRKLMKEEEPSKRMVKQEESSNCDQNDVLNTIGTNDLLRDENEEDFDFDDDLLQPYGSRKNEDPSSDDESDQGAEFTLKELVKSDESDEEVAASDEGEQTLSDYQVHVKPTPRFDPGRPETSQKLIVKKGLRTKKDVDVEEKTSEPAKQAPNKNLDMKPGKKGAKMSLFERFIKLPHKQNVKKTIPKLVVATPSQVKADISRSGQLTDIYYHTPHTRSGIVLPQLPAHLRVKKEQSSEDSQQNSSSIIQASHEELSALGLSPNTPDLTNSAGYLFLQKHRQASKKDAKKSPPL